MKKATHCEGSKKAHPKSKIDDPPDHFQAVLLLELVKNGLKHNILPTLKLLAKEGIRNKEEVIPRSDFQLNLISFLNFGNKLPTSAAKRLTMCYIQHSSQYRFWVITNDVLFWQCCQLWLIYNPKTVSIPIELLVNRVGNTASCSLK